MRKELKETFEKYGDTFTQVEKNETYIIYSRETNGKITSYEVFDYRVRPFNPNSYIDRVSIEQGYTEVELYPSDESFGVWAYNPSTWDGVKRVLKREYDVEL